MKIQKLKCRNLFLSKGFVKIGDIASSVEYGIDEKLKNLPIFGAKYWCIKLKKILSIC